MRCLYSLSLCFLLLSACQPPAESMAVPMIISRAQAIPADAHKFTPPEDPAPPILHNVEWKAPKKTGG